MGDFAAAEAIIKFAIASKSSTNKSNWREPSTGDVEAENWLLIV